MSKESQYNPTFKFALRDDLKDNKEFLPTRAEPKATGWDVRAAMADRKPLAIKPFQKFMIPLGFRGFCPPGWWYELKPRSSTFGKKSLHSLYGTIDETYEGELVFACQYIPELEIKAELIQPYGSGYKITGIETTIVAKTLTINFADAIGQIIPVRREEMNVVEASNEEYDADSATRDAVRKAGGFGSTGT